MRRNGVQGSRATCATSWRAPTRIERSIGKHFHLLESFNDIGPLPPGFDLDSWNIVTGPPTSTVTDGDRIDLGSRTLVVMHTPGHTPDSICLYDERDGLLFTGDTVLTGANLAQFNEADLDAYAASTRRLADMAGNVSMVVPHHYGRTTIDPAFLTEVADGMEEVAAGEATLVPSIGSVQQSGRSQPCTTASASWSPIPIWNRCRVHRDQHRRITPEGADDLMAKHRTARVQTEPTTSTRS